MRHFLRIDAGVAVGPSLGAVTFIKSGETLHLNEDDPVEGKVAHDIAASSSGWVEVDEAGAAVPKRRQASANPVVTDTNQGDEPVDSDLSTEIEDTSGEEPLPQV